MLPARLSLLALWRVLAVVLALFVAGCAANRPEPLPPPDEIAAFVGETREDTFVNPDGLGIYGQYWLPAGNARAVVVLVHGTTMHSGLYDEFGRFLAARGYAVYGIDLQGWGRSDGIGPRGDVFNHDKYVTDVGIVIDRMRAEFPDRPIFGFGESLGGTVCLLGQVQRRTFFDGLILSAPAYKPNFRLPGGFHAPEIFNNWIFGSAAWWGKHFEHWPMASSNLGLRYIIADDVMQEQLLDDPYVSHNWLPGRYVTALVESNKYLAKRIEVINVPLYILHGDRDQLVPKASSEELILRTLSRDKRLKIFQGMGHAVMLQPERYEAMVEIGRWLDDRTVPR